MVSWSFTIPDRKLRESRKQGKGFSAPELAAEGEILMEESSD